MWLMTRSDDWTGTLREMSDSRKDVAASVESGLKELKKFGYLIKRERKTQGQIETEYIVFQTVEQAQEFAKQLEEEW